MVGLLDIAPVTEKVHGVEVCGVSIEGIAKLMFRFPQIEGLLLGKELSVAEILQLAPECVAAIIAAGVGFPNDEAQEAKAAKLPGRIQGDFIAAIVRLTVPDGLRPLLQRLSATAAEPGVATEAASEASTKAPASNSDTPSPDSAKRVTRPL